MDKLLSTFLVTILLFAAIVAIFNSEGYQEALQAQTSITRIRENARTDRLEIRSEAFRENLQTVIVFLAGGVVLIFTGIIFYKISSVHSQRQHEYNMRVLEINERRLLAQPQQNRPRIKEPSVVNNYTVTNNYLTTTIDWDVFEKFLKNDKYNVIPTNEVDGGYYIVDKQTNNRKLITVKE